MAQGSRIGEYEIVAPIGKGGMGEVYRARDPKLGRDVAIKVLPHEMASDSNRLRRFEWEARAASALNHPNIVTIYEIGEHDGSPFIVMEYVEGATLREILTVAPLPRDKLFRYATQLAEGLAKAHQAGIVHRDLKPDNIVISKDGYAKILDFGLAKLMPSQVDSEMNTFDYVMTREGVIMGTVHYMSPEQAAGGSVDFRSDQFALGSILYEMATGNKPFERDTAVETLAAIIREEPESVKVANPEVSETATRVIARCLSKDPRGRYDSTGDIAKEFYWEERPTPVPSTTRGRAAYRVTYFQSPDGASIAAARGGSGKPLVVIPSMADTIEASWGTYASLFESRELIMYDRRGTGLSERDTTPGKAEPYLRDAQAVIDGFRLDEFDLLGTLLGTVEATWLASRNTERVRRLVLRAPVTRLADWATIPAVRAALAAMDEDWEYFTESFSQLVVGWGNPGGRALAARFRTTTTRGELRAIFDSYVKLDLIASYPKIQAPTLVEHHPRYFFPDSYSRRIASLIDDCRMEIFSGEASAFMTDLSIANVFLTDDPLGR